MEKQFSSFSGGLHGASNSYSHAQSYVQDVQGRFQNVSSWELYTSSPVWRHERLRRRHLGLCTGATQRTTGKGTASTATNIQELQEAHLKSPQLMSQWSHSYLRVTIFCSDHFWALSKESKSEANSGLTLGWTRVQASGHTSYTSWHLVALALALRKVLHLGRSHRKTLDTSKMQMPWSLEPQHARGCPK